MTAFLIVHGTRADRVEADTPEEACLEAARTYSVWDNVAGITFAVYPLDFHKKVRVQYENPHAEGERLPDYGKVIVREELVQVPGYDRKKKGVLRSA